MNPNNLRNDAKQFVVEFAMQAIMCLPEHQKKYAERAINIAIFNHDKLCTLVGVLPARQISTDESREKTAILDYATMLQQQRAEAFKLGLLDSNGKDDILLSSQAIAITDALQHCFNSMDRKKYMSLCNDVNPRIAVSVEAIMCCCTAIALKLKAVEVWPVPPQVWGPHKRVLKDAG